MNLEKVERKFIFRISRGLFLTAAGILGLGMLLAVLFFAYTVSPTIKGAAPAEPTVPAAPQITVADIERLLPKEDDTEATPIPQPVALEEQETEVEQYVAPTGLTDQQRIEDLFERIHAFFPGDGFPWASDWHYKQRGVKPRLDWGIQFLDNSQRVTFLTTVLNFLPLIQEELRHDAAQSLADIARAYHSPATESMTLLTSLLTGEMNKPEGGTATPLSATERKVLFDFIFGTTKRNTPIETFNLVLKKWTTLTALVVATESAAPMIALWRTLEGTEEPQAAQTLAAYEKLLPELEAKHRVTAMFLYNNILHNKNRAQQSDYRRAMDQYRSEMAGREAAYMTKIVTKKGLRQFALYGLAGTIFGLAFLGLLLALLGIERNTRALQQVLAAMNDTGRDQDDSAAP